jgi:hypothetical protein
MRGPSKSEAVSSSHRAAAANTRAPVAAMALIWLRLFVMCTPDAPPANCETGKCSEEGDGSGGMASLDPPKRVTAPGCTADSDCPKAEYCAGGACVKDVCEQGRASCDPKGPAVVLCSPSGDRELRLRCSTGQSCNGEPGQARCSDWVCTPGAMSCNADGKSLEVCAMDGLSTEAVADCTRTKQVCAAGACKDTICKPTRKLCDASAVYLCSADGTSRTLIETCTNQQYCDADGTACKPRVCTPGSVECQMDRPATCRADGSGWDPGDECGTGELCTLGTCQPLVCKPNKEFCSGGSARRCSADGLSSSILTPCDASSYHCVETASGASCEVNYCYPSGPICEGNITTTCKPDGSGPVAGGTNCGADRACYNGACQQKVCTPAATFCKDGNLQACDSVGLSYTTLLYCGAGQYCNVPASTCSEQVCVPGTHGCTGEVFGSCKADGSGYTPETNCASTGKVCSTGGCDASAIDEVGETTQGGESQSVSTFYGNVVSIKTSRMLTKIEMGLDEIFGPYQGTLQWAVYESTGGTFARIVSETTPYSAPLPSSKSLKASLVAGRTYVIGVYIVPGSSGLVVYEASGAPEGVTFGEVTGAFIVQSDTLPTTLPSTPTRTDIVDHQRLTTGPPPP